MVSVMNCLLGECGLVKVFYMKGGFEFLYFGVGRECWMKVLMLMFC